MDERSLFAAMDNIVLELEAAGYDPYTQLTGYILTGQSNYITRRNGVREQIEKIDKEFVLKYVRDMEKK